MANTITDKGLVTKDSSEAFVYEFDLDDALPAAVQLIGAGTIVVTPSTGLTISNQALAVGNRKVQCLIAGGTLGRTYTIELTVTTNENPAQVFSPWFKLRIT